MAGFDLSGGIFSRSDVVVESIHDLDWITTLGAMLWEEVVNRRLALIFGGQIKFVFSGPAKRSHPMIPILRQVSLLPRLAVVQHQPETVALVSRTLLGAVGDVASIGRIERRRVAGRIVGGNVLRRASADRDDPQIVVGRSRRILVVIRGVANLLPVRRKGIVILPAEREHGCVVVAGREVAGSWVNGPRDYFIRGNYPHDKDVAALACLVGIPV